MFFFDFFGGFVVDVVDDEGVVDVLRFDNGVYFVFGYCVDEVNDGCFIVGVVRWR